jgi:hypothetical protein
MGDGMMEDLYTTGEYHVISSKLDNCPLIDGQDEYEAWAGILAFLSIPPAAMVGALLYSVDPGAAVIWTICETIFFIGCLSVLLVFGITKDRCGICINLRNRNRNLKKKYYQFTNDSERDTARIKSIVDKYTANANTLKKFDEDEQEKFERKVAADNKRSEDCCVRYKDILGKVKP